MEKNLMTEENLNTTPSAETASNGDPSLGPNDVRLEIKLSLLGQKEIFVRDDVSVKLSNALSLAARGGVAATIESGVELMVQNALTQFNELVLRRYKKEASENQPG